jgi:chemotaxis protein MotB
LTDELLFGQGSYELDEVGKKLIDIQTPVILRVNADANISGHTDTTPGVVVNNDDLSALRAMAILERFLYGGIRPDRFSISGYGSDRPMFSNDTAEGRRKNRRVEILLKTTPRVAGYVN